MIASEKGEKNFQQIIKKEERIMLTKLQQKKLRKQFDGLCFNKSGNIGKADIEELIASISKRAGLGKSSNEYDKLLTQYMTFWSDLKDANDIDDDGKISTKEWEIYWDKVLEKEGKLNQMIKPVVELIFTLIDKSGEGKITLKEYKSFYKDLGLDEKLAEKIFPQLDHNKTGFLSKNEVSTLIERFYRSDDPKDPVNSFFGPI